jgi:hypothetical protein
VPLGESTQGRASTTAAAAPPVQRRMRRTGARSRSTAGMGRVSLLVAQAPAAAARRPLTSRGRSSRMPTMMAKTTRSRTPWSTLPAITACWRMPSTTAPARASGRLSRLARTAAARTVTTTGTVTPALPPTPVDMLSRTAPSPLSAPAISHTTACTPIGPMPRLRARSSLSAAARMARPMRARRRNRAISPSASTATATVSQAPVLSTTAPPRWMGALTGERVSAGALARLPPLGSKAFWMSSPA